jgi:pimeloyl-ACP methyl ester carboxylesterase
MTPGIVSRISHRDHAPLLGGPGPWWEALSHEFWRTREQFQLDPRDRARVGVTAFSDLVLRTLGACLIGASAFPLGYGPAQLEQARRDAEFYGPLAAGQDPGAVFPAPPPTRVESAEAVRPLHRPVSGRCDDVWFESPFVPLHPRMRERYLAHADNRIVRGRYWRHHQGPRPTLIAVHGFSADLYHLNEWFFALPKYYDLGFDLLLCTLPFHGRRQTRWSPFSGHGFFAGGAAQINEAMAQAVCDLRVFIDWLLEAQAATAVGITGISLGGLVSSVLAAAEPRLAFVIPNVPVVSLVDLVFEWEPIGAVLRRALSKQRTSIAEARYVLAVSSPLTYRPQVPRERRMIIGGVGDRLAPPHHARLLWEHWDRCRIHWFPGSHLVHLDRGSYADEARRFLAELGLPR